MCLASLTMLQVGDTSVDVEEGRNANAWTAAVLTGVLCGSCVGESGATSVLQKMYKFSRA
jgi:phosphoglycolate phosphatase-like HAD superfamily hydrolase